jgi:hypothetical protein
VGGGVRADELSEATAADPGAFLTTSTAPTAPATRQASSAAIAMAIQCIRVIVSGFLPMAGIPFPAQVTDYTMRRTMRQFYELTCREPPTNPIAWGMCHLPAQTAAW